MKKYMNEAIKEAKIAVAQGEIPIGAVIIKNDQIIGRGHNMTESLKDPTAHAEMIAIRSASKALGGWRLLDCQMYVTTEPCSMCAGAIVWSRLSKLYIGTMDTKGGACGSIFNIVQDKRLNHYVEVEIGIMEQECKHIMQEFFKQLRKRNGGNK